MRAWPHSPAGSCRRGTRQCWRRRANEQRLSLLVLVSLMSGIGCWVGAFLPGGSQQCSMQATSACMLARARKAGSAAALRYCTSPCAARPFKHVAVILAAAVIRLFHSQAMINLLLTVSYRTALADRPAVRPALRRVRSGLVRFPRAAAPGGRGGRAGGGAGRGGGAGALYSAAGAFVACFIVVYRLRVAACPWDAGGAGRCGRAGVLHAAASAPVAGLQFIVGYHVLCFVPCFLWQHTVVWTPKQEACITSTRLRPGCDPASSCISQRRNAQVDAFGIPDHLLATPIAGDWEAYNRVDNRGELLGPAFR